MLGGIVVGPVAGVTAIIIGLPIMMSLVALTFRYLSCWNKLEKRYLAKGVHVKQMFGIPAFRVVSPLDPFGLSAFRNVVCVGVAEQGLLFKPIWPLSLFFRPILIPWDEFLVSNEKYIGVSRDEVFLTEFPKIQFLLGSSMADKLRQAAATAPATSS